MPRGVRTARGLCEHYKTLAGKPPVAREACQCHPPGQVCGGETNGPDPLVKEDKGCGHLIRRRMSFSITKILSATNENPTIESEAIKPRSIYGIASSFASSLKRLATAQSACSVSSSCIWPADSSWCTESKAAVIVRLSSPLIERPNIPKKQKVPAKSCAISTIVSIVPVHDRLGWFLALMSPDTTPEVYLGLQNPHPSGGGGVVLRPSGVNEPGRHSPARTRRERYRGKPTPSLWFRIEPACSRRPKPPFAGRRPWRLGGGRGASTRGFVWTRGAGVGVAIALWWLVLFQASGCSLTIRLQRPGTLICSICSRVPAAMGSGIGPELLYTAHSSARGI